METFSSYLPFVQGIHWSLVNSPHKGQCRGALMFSLICGWTNGSVNNPDAGDLRCHRAHYDVTVMFIWYVQHLDFLLFYCVEVMVAVLNVSLPAIYASFVMETRLECFTGRSLVNTILTHCGLVIPSGITDLVNTGAGDGLLPNDTKPLTETMLT